MNENKEIAQRIIDKYITIFGVLPVFLFCSQIPDLNVNSKGKLLSITNDKITLLKLINALEPYSGKFIKSNVVKKYLTDYDEKKDIV
jgi:hypothetical protein